MQKQAPSIGRILIAVGFTLSCFGLILFLWIAFGGPIPLKPQSYRITAYFPEATQLALESDVRIGGVSVGKVKSIELAPPDKRVNGKDTTEAEIEIEPEFAPISQDAQAILRQKTLLGETFVELTSGTKPGEQAAPVSLGAAANVSDAQSNDIQTVPEGGTLGVSRTEEATQIDEIFNALDEETRASFQRWQANAATAIDGRGLDLNDAFGNLGPFVTDASDIIDVLDRQKAALKGVVRDTGTVFQALTERDQQLAGVVRGTDNTFDALASEDQALAQTFQILPTFQRESRATLERLDRFQANAHPLINQLIPVARDLSPTLRSVRELSPHLRNLFVDLGPLEDASVKGLPAVRDFLDGLRPVLDKLDPFLANLNPVIQYLEFQKKSVTDFLVGPSAALSGSYEPVPGDPAPRRGLRQLAYVGNEALAVWPSRLPTNRGNGYLEPGALTGYTSAKNGIFPNFDCKNTDFATGGLPSQQDTDEQDIVAGQSVDQINNGQPPDVAFAPCFHAGDFENSKLGNFGDDRFPSYSKSHRILPVPYFETADEVYATLGRLFVELASDPELAPKFRRANTIVRYEYSEPESVITVRLQEDQPGDVDFGESEMEPEVTMTMAADTAHEFWLGQVNVTVALARGQIKAKGPVAKILKLVPLAKPAFPRYKAQLEEQGRADLASV